MPDDTYPVGYRTRVSVQSGCVRAQPVMDRLDDYLTRPPSRRTDRPLPIDRLTGLQGLLETAHRLVVEVEIDGTGRPVPVRCRPHVMQRPPPRCPPVLVLRSPWREKPAVVVVMSDGRRIPCPSQPRLNDLSPKDMADDLAVVLDRLGVAKVSVVAHDWGGPIAAYLTLRHPKKVAGFSD